MELLALKYRPKESINIMSMRDKCDKSHGCPIAGDLLTPGVGIKEKFLFRAKGNRLDQ